MTVCVAIETEEDPLATVDQLHERVERLERAEREWRRVEEHLRESEARFRTLVENAGDAFFLCEEDGQIVDVNHRACVSSGYTRDQLLTKRLWELAEHVTPAAFADQIRQMIETAEPITVTGHHRRKDGTRYPVEVRATLFDAAGRRRIQGLVRDVTDRVHAEQALRESEERFHRIFQSSNDAILVIDPSRDRIIDANRKASEMLGYSREELLETPSSAIHPHELPVLQRFVESVMRDGQGWTNELTCITKSGQRVPAEISASMVNLEDDHYVIALVRDVTARREAEVALRRSEARFRRLVEHAADAFFLVDGEGCFVNVNQRACDALGYTRDELLRLSVPDIDVETNATEVRQLWRSIIPGQPVTVHGVHRRKGGTRFPVEVRIGAFEEGEGTLRVALARDITERVESERALRDGEARISNILASAMDAIVAVDDELTVALFNAAAEVVFGCPASEVIGTSFKPFLAPCFHRVLTDYIRRSESGVNPGPHGWTPAGLTARRIDGGEFPIEATISRTEAGDQHLYTVILRDINERQQAEVQLHQLRLETLYLRQELETELHLGEFVGSSRAIRQVLQQIETVAPTDSTVLITGETGTGKELVARAIHQAGPRKARALVKVNCAALPEGLIESELFGHEKGAFTGAVARKIGRFEMADGGTIFLDEIGDLPPNVQAKLLRVLQEGEFERVGGTKSLKVDVRVMAATNRNVEGAMVEGRFRADLFYRLNVFPIHVPPLRHRKDDLPLLVKYFVTKHGTKAGKRIDIVPADVMSALDRYDWPGNVRELENIIERAVILSTGPELGLGDWLPGKGAPVPGGPARLATLDDVQRAHIVRVLESTEWKVSGRRGAARVLGLKPTTLEARMKKLGIRRPG